MKVNTVHQGDCLDVMKTLPDNCIDTILTDPPYGLFFMGKNWDHGIPGEAYWSEALRVAKPGATLIACGGTRTYHRLVCAIENAKWEIRDSITYFHDGNQNEMTLFNSLDEEQQAAYLELHYPNMQINWCYGQGFPKSKDIGKAIDEKLGLEREVVGKHSDPNGVGINGTQSIGGSWQKEPSITAPSSPLAKQFDGHGTALKPAHEILVVAMKPIDKNYATNAEKWGVAGLDIDGARIGYDENDNYPNGNGLRYGETSMGSFGKMQTRPYVQDRVSKGEPVNTSMPHTKGRYPANIIHDSSEVVLREFGKAGEKLPPWGKKESKSVSRTKNAYSISRERFIDNGLYQDGGTSASRFFQSCPSDTEPSRLLYYSKASPTERGDNKHPTVKPLAVFRYLARLTKIPTGGLVLDPFAGSGTTALACIAEGRDYILIEKEPAYIDIINRRIAEFTGQAIPEQKEIKTKDGKAKQLGLW